MTLLNFFALYFVNNDFHLHIDCESLIRKMLVLDPHRRYTIEQIKHHRWMMIEVIDPISLACDKQNVSARNGTAITEPNEQILRLMAGLGIDTQKTCESLKVSTSIIRAIFEEKSSICILFFTS